MKHKLESRLPGEVSITLDDVCSDFLASLLKNTFWKGGAKESTVEKPDKHYLSRVIKANINSCKSNGYKLI